MLEIENFTEEDKNKLEQYMLNDKNPKKTKVYLNVEKSLKLCSWEQAKKLNDIEDNKLSDILEYIHRDKVPYNRILIINKKQVRNQLVDQINAKQVVNPSLDVHGWIHELAPMMVITMKDAIKQRIIKVGDSRIDDYDYVLIFGFTRHQEMGNLGWDECIVDIVKCSPLVQREIGLDSNLHIGKQGKPNTTESIVNQALLAVENDGLPEDKVRDWIRNRARDRKRPETIYQKYLEQKPTTGPMKTFNMDKDNPNSIIDYALLNDMPYGGDENSQHGFGTINKKARSKSQWKIIEDTILENPELEEIIYGLWVQNPNPKTIKQDRINQKNNAKEFLLDRAKFIQTIIKRVNEKDGNLSKVDDIIEHGYRVKIKHVAQDLETVLEGGELKEQGFID